MNIPRHKDKTSVEQMLKKIDEIMENLKKIPSDIGIKLPKEDYDRKSEGKGFPESVENPLKKLIFQK